MCARGGIDIYSIADQLSSVYVCPSYARRNALDHDCSKGSSCPSAIANAIIDMYEEMQSELFDDEEEYVPQIDKTIGVKHNNTTIRLPKIKNVARCPECGGELVFEGGCNSCKQCGYSKCN